MSPDLLTVFTSLTSSHHKADVLESLYTVTGGECILIVPLEWYESTNLTPLLNNCNTNQDGHLSSLLAFSSSYICR